MSNLTSAPTNARHPKTALARRQNAPTIAV
jgi:hypothetical protein